MKNIEKYDLVGKPKFLSSGESTLQVRSNHNEKFINHQIYDRLLSFLENRQIHNIESKRNLQFILHKKTKERLQKEHRFTNKDIELLENSIYRDVEDLSEYEIVSDVPRNLYAEFRKDNKTSLIGENRIVALPNWVENLCICKALEEYFSKEQILNCDGFIGDCGRNEYGEHYSMIHLDIDGWIVRNGFMMPILPSGRKGLIEGLRVYRHQKDEKPFRLRSRNKYCGGKTND